MSDTDELLAEVAKQTGSQEEEPADTSTGQTQPDPTVGGGQSSSRLKDGALSAVPSARGALIATVVSGVGMLAGGLVPFIGGVTGLLGIGIGGFLLGMIDEGRYVDVAIGGGVTAAAALFLGRLTLSVAGGFAVPLALLGGVLGVLAAVVGLYFGRDLRNGVSREI